MLYICLSFDYELFLGENRESEQKILFEPTRKIVDMLNKQGVAGTFFADVCSVFQYKKYSMEEYPRAFKEQLRYMNEKQQDVQLHIHPNWLKSSPTGDGNWHIDVESYKLHYFEHDSEYSMNSIFKMGKEYLESVIGENDENYKCIAYRAGGFCIQPEEKIIDCMLENDIRIESSVAPYLVAKGAVNDYNFLKLPKKANWWVDSKKGLSSTVEKSEKSVLEIPIGTVRNNIFRFLKTPMKEWHVPPHQVLGTSIKLPQKKENKLVALVRNCYRRAFGYGILSLDSRGYKILLGDLEQLYKKYNCKDEDVYICTICHPKLANQETIDNMERFIEEVKKKNDKFAFVNLREIYDKEVVENTGI